MKFKESKELTSCVTAGNQKCQLPKPGFSPQHGLVSLG